MNADRHIQKLILSPKISLRRKLDLLFQTAPSERFYLRVIRSKVAHPKVRAAVTTALQELRANRANRKEQNAILAELAARVPEAVIQKMDTPTLTVAAVQKSDEPETVSNSPATEPVRKTDTSSTESVQKMDKQISALAKAILAGDQPSEASFEIARNLAREVTEARLRYFYAEEFSRELRFSGLRLIAERQLADFLNHPALVEYSQSYMNSIYQRTRCDVLTSSWDDLNYNQKRVKADLRLLAEKSPDAEIRQKALARIAPPAVDREPMFNEKYLPESRVVCEQNFLFMTATHPELPAETRKQAVARLEAASRWLTTGGPYSNFLLQWIAFLKRNPASPLPNFAIYERRRPPQGAFAAQPPYPNGLE
jgi:hypothetical protein